MSIGDDNYILYGPNVTIEDFKDDNPNWYYSLHTLGCQLDILGDKGYWVRYDCVFVLQKRIGDKSWSYAIDYKEPNTIVERAYSLLKLGRSKELDSIWTLFTTLNSDNMKLGSILLLNHILETKEPKLDILVPITHTIKDWMLRT